MVDLFKKIYDAIWNLFVSKPDAYEQSLKELENHDH